MCNSAINFSLYKAFKMQSGSNFKNTPAVLIILRADASKFLLLEDAPVSKANQSKEKRVFH